MGIEENKYLLTEEDKKRIEERVKEFRKKIKPLTDAIERSERLTAEDYNVTVTTIPLNLPKDYDFSQMFKDY